MSTTTAVTPENILKDLRKQWEDLAHEEAKSGGGVLRACAMTLVVAARNEEAALDARQTAGMLMRVHPSRAIIVHPGKEFNARVFAECWKPMGRAQQICSEGVEIVAGPNGFDEVARFLVPLRVPDLPVVLWCRNSAAIDNSGYHQLYPLADKIIFDTQKASDSDNAIRSLRRLHAYGMRVADLHWTRLSGWREVVAHLFDRGLNSKDIRSARITYGGGTITTCARYFEAWVRSSLPLARVSIEPEYGPAGVYSLTFFTPQGDLSITHTADHTLTITGRGMNYQMGLPSITEATLMQEELSILGPDDVYERVLNA